MKQELPGQLQSRREKQFFLPVLADVNIESLKRENHYYSGRSSDAQKCCAFVEKFFAVKII